MTYNPDENQILMQIASHPGHEIAAAWVVLGGICILIAELKSHTKSPGVRGWWILGLAIIAIASTQGG